MKRFWFDTEFIEDGKTIDLISIGVVSDDGRTYYAENSECDLSRGSDWVQQNVIIHLTGEIKTRKAIASDLVVFMGEKPEIWAYYADYDWVALCQLFGTMIDLPKGWPMYCRDVKQLCDGIGNPKLPEQGSSEHHALADARWTKQAWEFLIAHDGERNFAVMCERSAAEAEIASNNFTVINEPAHSERHRIRAEAFREVAGSIGEKGAQRP